jgi:hypothetical protein
MTLRVSSRKSLSARVAIMALGLATFGAGTVALSQDAEARSGRRGAAIAAGIIGGIAAGALIAGAAQAQPRYYEPEYAPAYEPAYEPRYYQAPRHRYVPETTSAAGFYANGPRCYTQRQRYWIDEDTVAVRRVKVCE